MLKTNKAGSLIWTPHPVLPIPDIHMIVAKGWDKDMQGLIRYHHQREELILNMKDDPYRYGHELDHWLRSDLLLKHHSLLMILGGNRCISGSSEIYDPRVGKRRKVREISSSFYVRSWDGKKMVNARACKPFIKGHEMMYRVELSNGENLEVTANHRLLTPEGYQSLSSLSVGSHLCSPSQKDDHQPYIQASYVQTDSCTSADSQVDYQGGSRLYDELLHEARESVQFLSPSPAYVPLHNHDHMCEGDVAEIKPYSFRPSSILCCLSTLFHASCRRVTSLIDSLHSALQSFSESSEIQPSVGYHGYVPDSSSLSFCEYSYSKLISIISIKSTKRQEVWDFHVPIHNNYELAGAISHNSGKTEYAGKRVVQSAMNNPESIIWCFQTTFENSVQMQQKVIWKYIPKELKSIKRDKVTNISYSQKRGFSDGKLVFPNGSEIVFRNYSQDITTIEGGEIGCMTPAEGLPHVHNIGFWGDELMPQAWLDTLRFRLVTRDSIGILTFTPIEGYSPMVKEFMNGAITEEEIESDILKGYKVPIIQQPKRQDDKIIYYQTKDNPYGGYERIKKTLEGAHRDDILCRAHGVPVKPMAGKFPKFSHKTNVVKHEEIPFIKDKSQAVTHYMCIDPSGAKPYFMVWVGVTAMDEVYVWAEYPDVSYGDWADMSKGTKGRFGDGAKPNGFGYQDYKDVIDEIEEGKPIFERLIDSRAGATRYQNDECQTCSIDELINIGVDVIPASGLDEDQGIQAINKYLAWDDSKEMHIGNKPRLFISDRCGQLIYAMTEYTGMLGKDEPTKDPIDCLRYLLIGNIMHIDENQSHFIRDSR